MKRNCFLLQLLLTLILTACVPQTLSTTNPATSTPEKSLPDTEVPSDTTFMTIVDVLSREVTLSATPQRIVLPGREIFMVADAAYLFPDALEKITGLSDAGQGTANFIELIDPNYEKKAILEIDSDAEQIAALQPDLVLLKSDLAESVGAPIEAMGIPVVYVDFETPDQYPRDLAILGQVFGDEPRAIEVASYFQTKVYEISQTVKDAPRPRVLILSCAESDGNKVFYVPLMNSMQTQIVKLAGGEPVWEGANPALGWTQVTLQQVAEWDADQIFIISYENNSSEVAAGLRVDPNWSAIRAVKDGKLYGFAADLYSWDQPDPRWILGLAWLAGKLHPDLFLTVDISTEAQIFYQTLYGLDKNFFEHNILPTFNGDLPRG
jgi:iron complex transport system substrate-binding protein